MFTCMDIGPDTEKPSGHEDTVLMGSPVLYLATCPPCWPPQAKREEQVFVLLCFLFSVSFSTFS